jgi:putative transposase
MERWLREAGVVRKSKCRSRVIYLPRRQDRRRAYRPNDVWPIDFKGRFAWPDGPRVEPLTVSDLATRYGLAVQVLPAKDYACTKAALVKLFRRYGLPRAIQVDNGPPFGSEGTLGLSRLSAEWTRLGIEVQFSRPACPADNAQHERWHRTLQEDLRLYPLREGEAPQDRINRILHLYNHDRSHAVLGGRRPAQLYRPSRRRYHHVQPRHYPAHWYSVIPNRKGCAWWAGRSRLFGRAFVGQKLGLRPHQSGRWDVYLDYLRIGLLVAADPGGMRPLRWTHQVNQDGEGFALPCTPPTTYPLSQSKL